MSAIADNVRPPRKLLRKDSIASYKFYRVAFRLAAPVIRFFRPFEVIGKENMFKGAAMVCSNHSAMIDPFQIALAFGIDDNVHVIAKIELFRIPVVSWFLWKLGMICVDRSINDIESIKTSLLYMKKGEKVVIFPEGTRMSQYDAHAAKSGAVKLAERAGVPIIPVFITRNKPFFRKSKVVIGKPYNIEKHEGKRHVDDYTKLSEELMANIQDLDPDLKT
ncbi:MAG: 1-acyl-sn-glycerol-3-phosphate acyltransferase [Oscillospiraceae bacterium]|nr:1-acyl-sn-glycerol-3-phosphate acyltransferase [Oscillospiraceae bacterium]